MRRAGEHGFRQILFAARHAFNTFAAAVLGLVGVDRLAFDIAEVCQRKDAGFFGNQIFNIDFARDVDNFRAAGVCEFVADGAQFVFHNRKHALFRIEDFQIFLDFAAQFVALFQNLFDFKTGQLTDAVSDNRGRLGLVKAEFFNNRGLRFGNAAFAGANGGDDVVDNINRAGKTFQNVLAVLRFL